MTLLRITAVGYWERKKTVPKLVLGISLSGSTPRCARHPNRVAWHAKTSAGKTDLSSICWHRDTTHHTTSTLAFSQVYLERSVGEVLQSEPAALMPPNLRASPQPPSAPLNRGGRPPLLPTVNTPLVRGC